jgi:ABC-type polysaccharide/polyol phosphate export permease
LRGREREVEAYTPRKLRESLYSVFVSSWSEVKIYFRYRASMIIGLITTPMWVLFFVLNFNLFLPPAYRGLVQRSLMWSFIFLEMFSEAIWNLGMSLRRMKEMGIIEHVIATGSLFSTLLGRLSRIITDTIIYGIYMILFFYLALGVDISIRSPVLFLISAAMALASCFGFSSIFSSLSYGRRNVAALINILQFPVMIASGIILPAWVLPPQLRIIALISPLTYPFDLMRNAATGEQTLLDIRLELFLSLISAIFMMLISKKFIERVERKEMTGEVPGTL